MVDRLRNGLVALDDGAVFHNGNFVLPVLQVEQVVKSFFCIVSNFAIRFVDHRRRIAITVAAAIPDVFSFFGLGSSRFTAGFTAGFAALIAAAPIAT